MYIIFRYVIWGGINLIGCIDIGIFGVIDRLSNETECTVCIGGYYCDF